jgi:hypothetical protein
MSRLFFVLILLITSHTLAASVDNLYQAQAEITSQGEQERQQVTAVILQKVLLKVVGDRAALANKDIRPLLNHADRFVERYAYVQQDKQGNKTAQSLSLTFNEQGLNDTLRALALPIWGKSRPEVLLWLVIKEGKQQTILGSESRSSLLFGVIQQQADNRGLSLFLPLMDLEDQQQLRHAQSSQALDEANPFLLAAKRYGARVILLATVKKQVENISVDWQWQVDGQHEQFKSEGEPVDTLASGVDQLADALATQLSQLDKSPVKQNYQLHISQVKDFTDHSRVVSYLTNLQTVSKVDVMSLNASGLDVSIVLDAGLLIFERILEVDGFLSKQAITKEPPPTILQYRLNP